MFELQRALALGGLNFSLKTVQTLMRLHDPDANGQIDIKVCACVVWVQPGSSHPSPWKASLSASPVPPFPPQEFERLHLFLTGVTQAFRTYDTDRSGAPHGPCGSRLEGLGCRPCNCWSLCRGWLAATLAHGLPGLGGHNSATTWSFVAQQEATGCCEDSPGGGGVSWPVPAAGVTLHTCHHP